MDCRSCLDHIQQELLLLHGGLVGLRSPVFAFILKYMLF